MAVTAPLFVEESSNQWRIESEVERLRRVLVHRPGCELRRLTPANKDQLLFDGVPWCERAQEDHDAFTELMCRRGVEVYYLRDLLAEVLELELVRAELIRTAIDADLIGKRLHRYIECRLRELTQAELADVLIGGMTMAELGASSECLVVRIADPRDFAVAPLPNHMFMRDSSSWIGSRPHLGTMALGARRRESAHLAAIYRHHPLFTGGEPPLLEPGLFEGGDVLVLGADRVLAGVGSRSGAAAVERLAAELTKHSPEALVLVALLPRNRATIHLDTVVTMVDRDAFTVYRSVVEQMPVYRLDRGPHGLRIRQERDLASALTDALGAPLRWIQTGGDELARDREQWDDANNVLALEPGVVIAYDRNVATNERLSAAGVEVLSTPGSELGQGRGGPRCLSAPFERGGTSKRLTLQCTV
jgi:arginine deiminase